MTSAGIYRWRGLSRQGSAVRGWILARSGDAAHAVLRERGIIAASLAPALGGALAPRAKRVNVAALADTTQQLALMLAAGLPLLHAARLLARSNRHPTLRRELLAIADEVESGSRLADALEGQSETFDDLYIAMVSAGEASGQLAGTFEQLAAILRRRARLRAQLTRALFYPLTILTVGLGVATLLLLFVIPSFEQTFASFGAQLPLPTLVVISASAWLARLGPVAIVAVAAIAWRVRALYREDDGRLKIDRLLLRTPGLGTLLRNAAAARLASALATLTRSGVPILEALGVAAPLTGNRALELAVGSVERSVAAGKALGAAIAEERIFPELLPELITLGEQTGALDTMLARAAEHFEGEIEQKLGIWMGALEPAAVVFLGVTLGGLVIAMYLPVFQMGGLG